MPAPAWHLGYMLLGLWVWRAPPKDCDWNIKREVEKAKICLPNKRWRLQGLRQEDWSRMIITRFVWSRNIQVMQRLARSLCLVLPHSFLSGLSSFLPENNKPLAPILAASKFVGRARAVQYLLGAAEVRVGPKHAASKNPCHGMKGCQMTTLSACRMQD